MVFFTYIVNEVVPSVFEVRTQRKTMLTFSVDLVFRVGCVVAANE
jgi:hypothetical protein